MRSSGSSPQPRYIAGLAALMKSVSSSLTPAQIESAIKSNVRALPGSCSGGYGAGLADATKTVQAVSGSGGTTYTSTAAVAIPDNGSAIESPITVSGRSGNAPSALQVGVDITHTYRGDLVLDLVAPDASTYRLKSSSSSDSADDVNTTYTVNASGESANGTLNSWVFWSGVRTDASASGRAGRCDGAPAGPPSVCRRMSASVRLRPPVAYRGEAGRADSAQDVHAFASFAPAIGQAGAICVIGQ